MEVKYMRVLIKGAGDLASGIACRLSVCGMQIIMTEIQVPTTVRRMVAFSRAVYEKYAVVEGIRGCLVSDEKELEKVLGNNEIAVIVDPELHYMEWYQPDVLVDAIIAKKNTGTKITDANLVIGVGPGFKAGEDCNYVVETKRGHNLGKVIWKGAALPNTGIPGSISGHTIDRIIRAEGTGLFVPIVQIGELVEVGQVVAVSGKTPIKAQISGMIRGMLQPGLMVEKGMKCGDIDPRCDIEQCMTVSDKARAVGGGVLEAIYRKENSKE